MMLNIAIKSVLFPYFPSQSTKQRLKWVSITHLITQELFGGFKQFLSFWKKDIYSNFPYSKTMSCGVGQLGFLMQTKTENGNPKISFSFSHMVL